METLRPLGQFFTFSTFLLAGALPEPRDLRLLRRILHLLLLRGQVGLREQRIPEAGPHKVLYIYLYTYSTSITMSPEI